MGDTRNSALLSIDDSDHYDRIVIELLKLSGHRYWPSDRKWTVYNFFDFEEEESLRMCSTMPVRRGKWRKREREKKKSAVSLAIVKLIFIIWRVQISEVCTVLSSCYRGAFFLFPLQLPSSRTDEWRKQIISVWSSPLFMFLPFNEGGSPPL